MKTAFTIDMERAVSFVFPQSGRLAAMGGSSLNRLKRGKDAKQRLDVPLPAVKYRSLIPKLTIKSGEVKKSTMNKRTAGKIRKKTMAMYGCGMAKTFVTLTVLADCIDRQAYDALKNWLKQMKKRYKGFEYLWVIERQANGRPHFHIVVNQVLNIKQDQLTWVKCQYNQGIVYKTCEHKGTKLGKKYTLDPTNMSAEKVASWVNPLDVVRISSERGLSLYLAGYVSKSVGAQFECQVWQCSKAVSALFTSVVIPRALYIDMQDIAVGSCNVFVYTNDIKNSKGKVVHKAGDIVLPRCGYNDYCSWVYIVNHKAMSKHLKVIHDSNAFMLTGGTIEIPKYTYNEFEHEYCDRAYFFKPGCRKEDISEKIFEPFTEDELYRYNWMAHRVLDVKGKPSGLLNFRVDLENIWKIFSKN